MNRRILPVFADQLSPGLASLAAGDPERDVVLMAEVADETRYVRHHKKKIVFLFSAMRHFAEELRQAGWTVDYVPLDAAENTGSLTGEADRAAARHGAGAILLTEPGEWRVRKALETWADDFNGSVDILEDDRFLASHSRFADWAEGRKELRMEYFYREMRRETGLLMTEEGPEGGKWNYDAENRKRAPSDKAWPSPYRVEPDTVTREVLTLVGDRFGDHFGDLEPFWFAVTRIDAEAALAHFIESALPEFGDYQDAMLKGERFLAHSVLSLYINCGLLDPLAVACAAEAAYRQGRVPLNAAEGFIRQIIGWREFIRGVYWLKMPEYRERNALGANRPLPEFYWTGDTDMACLRAAVEQTRAEAYAHHIQRLMVTGNFAMLAGIDPHAVHEWYLAVYADAFEWVELPNTLGMSQFADGGVVGSKPYAASGAYIHKMSDYCGTCRYDVKQKTGPDACPFNALYWDFLIRNEQVLRGNPRLGPVFRTWDKMADDKQAAYRETARTFLKSLD